VRTLGTGVCFFIGGLMGETSLFFFFFMADFFYSGGDHGPSRSPHRSVSGCSKASPISTDPCEVPGAEL
jgi:hypothetical protein